MNYMKLAQQVAELSGCKKLQVGAVIIKNNNLLAVGFNKAMSECKSLSHCQIGGHCLSTIHAEQMAIAECAKQGFSTKGAVMYVTFEPCHICRKNIIEAGISKVYYLHEYKNELNERFTGDVEWIKWEGTE